MMRPRRNQLWANLIRLSTAAVMLVAGFGAISTPAAPAARADVVAYLINVHVRPGYNFPNGDVAIAYGQTICDRVATKMPYPQLVDQLKVDFRTSDYYQAGYLINQAINELCPAHIWQLRESAAGYTAYLKDGGNASSIKEVRELDIDGKCMSFMHIASRPPVYLCNRA